MCDCINARVCCVVHSAEALLSMQYLASANKDAIIWFGLVLCGINCELVYACS